MPQLTYEEALTARTEQWYTETQEATTKAEWDEAFDLYAADVERIQEDYNHPVDPPRKRP